MAYSLENATFAWADGELRVKEEGGLEDAVWKVVEALRQRLGGPFEIAELVDLYSEGTDWADDVAARAAGVASASAVVDAAFGRFAREASDYAGGRRYVRE